MKRLLIAALSTSAVLSVQAPAVVVQAAQTVWNTPVPTTIRVAIRENNPSGEPDPRGKIVRVQYIPFETYCKDVLPNEWMPGWSTESLKAGAMAVKMFAWFHHLHPLTVDGFTFDVDNTTNFQTFRYLSGEMQTNQAVDAIRGEAYSKPNGEIIELNYRAGKRDDPNWQYRNAQKMAQWGSEYWAEKGRSYLQILQFYYIDRALEKIKE